MDVLDEWTTPGIVDIPGLCLAYRARLTSAKSGHSHYRATCPAQIQPSAERPFTSRGQRARGTQCGRKSTQATPRI